MNEPTNTKVLVQSYLQSNVSTIDWFDFLCALKKISTNYTLKALVDIEVLKGVRPCEC
jgi:hypothetical protein